MKMSFICMRMKNHLTQNFHIKGWTLNLVLIQRPGELGNGLLVSFWETGDSFPLIICSRDT